MIRAGHLQHRRAANAIFLRDTNRRFHFRQFTGNNDLSQRIDVGNIDILIGGELANVVLQSADHCRHSANCRRASFIHKFAAFLDKLEAVRELESSSRSVRGHFA